MFGKLKDKLKKGLSLFSKKTEEEAEDIPQEEVEKVLEAAKQKEEQAASKEEKVVVEDKSEEGDEKEAVKEEAESKQEIVETPEKELEQVEEQAPAEEKEVGPSVLPLPEVESEKNEDKEAEKKTIHSDLGLDHIKAERVKEIEISEELVEREKAQIEKEKPVVKKKEVVQEKKEIQKEVKKVKEEVEETPKKSFFGRVRETLTTKKISADKFEELFWELELILLESNVSVEVIEKIKEDLKEELVDKPLPRDVMGKIQEVLENTLREILSIEQYDILDLIAKKKANDEGKPFVIMFFGINGAGKTTSIAKLTHYLQGKELSVVLAAGDTFRAAAIQQLEEHAVKLGVKMIKHDYGADAAAVAFDAVRFAEKNNVDVVLIDTAGRLHSNTNLMNELDKINRIANPDLKIFVGESITGNDCIEQAQKFNELVDLDGAILTKADIDENGGAPLSIAYTIKKPILFLGMGQEYKDLEKFDPELILKRLGFSA